MSDEIISFYVASLHVDGASLNTTVEHRAGAMADGTFRDAVRITQHNPARPDEPDVVLLDRADFENISKILKGH